MIGGDPGELRSKARQLRILASDIAMDRATMTGAVAGVQWQSTAADHFRTLVTEKGHDVDGVVAGFERAATQLDHLASTVESRQQTLAHLAEQAGRTVEEIYHTALSTGQDVMHAAEGLAGAALAEAENLAGKGKQLLDDVTGGWL